MTLNVGMPVSLTGQFQLQGCQALAGLQAWAKDVNSKSPNSLQVVHYDDASDRSMVREVTRRLIVEDHVDILIGPYSSVLTCSGSGCRGARKTALEPRRGFGRRLQARLPLDSGNTDSSQPLPDGAATHGAAG